MKLYSENNDYQMVRMSKEEFTEKGVKKGDLINFGSTYCTVFGHMEDGHGNVLVLVENPVTVHEYN